ncbi:MAG: trypsin-like serine protease [Caldilineaceae bacterium]
MLDVSGADYRAADPFVGGDPSALNVASLTDSDCVARCSWTRVIQSSWAQPVDWSVAASSAPSLTVTVEPAAFTLAPGASQTLTFTADVTQAFDTWVFGEIDFTASVADVAPAHFPMAVRATFGQLPSVVPIETRRNQGAYTVENLHTVAVDQLAVQIYASDPQLTELALAPDPTNDDPYDLAAGGVYTTLITVADTAKRLVVQTTNSTAPDLDLYVGLDANGDGLPERDEQLCGSTSSSAAEICDFSQLDGTLAPGVYWILVQNWTGSGAPTDSFTLSTLLIDATDTGLLSASGPASVTAGEPFTVQIGWNIPTFAAGDVKYGVLELGDASTGTSLGSVSIELRRLEDDVTLRSSTSDPLHPGDVVSYTIGVQAEPAVAGTQVRYILTDTIPTGMSYVADSASAPPTSVNGNVLTWAVDVSKVRQYVMSTNLTDPLCDTGFGGYVNLVDFGIFADPSIGGSGFSYRFDDFYGGIDPASFFGVDYPAGLYFTDDGFAHFDSSPGADPGFNTSIPDPAQPNNLAAALWRDLEVVYDPIENRGVSVAGAGSLMLVEYDGVEPAPAGSSSERYTFEILMDRFVNDTPGFYEIVFAYLGTEGSVVPATIGVENADGTRGVQYAYNNAVLQDGLMICFDWQMPEFAITYQAVVDADLAVPAVLTNTVQHTIAAPGFGVGVAELALEAPDVILDVSMTGPATVRPGEPISYTFTVTNSSSGTAPAVVATTDLPAATTLLRGGTITNGVISVDIGDLPGGSSRSVQVAVMPVSAVVQSAGAPQQPQAPLGPSIVGGGESEPGAWPWQAALMHASIADGFLAQFCGGTLVAPTWVLTAGHCVTNLDGSLKAIDSLDVAVGRLTLSSDEGERIAVSQIVRHPNYVETDYNTDFDLALIRLVKPVVLSDTVGLIAPLAPAQADLARPHIAAAVIGWGAQNDPVSNPLFGPNYADTLRETTVPIIDNETCAAIYDEYYGIPGVITDNMLCAGFREGGKDACYGDSGGPLMVWDDASGWLQAGIIASGLGCAQPNFYGVYTRVTNFHSWIMGDGRNTYITSGPFEAHDTAGHSAVGFKVISTVVQAEGAPTGQSYSTLVMPDSASTLRAAMGTLDIQMSIMTATVSQPISLTVRAADAVTTPNGFETLGIPFAVEVHDMGGATLDGFGFNIPIDTTISYAGEVAGLEGGAAGVTLQSYDTATGAWTPLAAEVDIKSSLLKSAINAAGIYAVLLASPTDLGENNEPVFEQRIFLPLIDIE